MYVTYCIIVLFRLYIVVGRRERSNSRGHRIFICSAKAAAAAAAVCVL